MNCEFFNSIHQFDASEWDALWPGNYPFTKHAFLAALETSGSIDSPEVRQIEGTGWKPHYLCAHENKQLKAAAPLFIKLHSYGEYVFDWSWANAYHQAGLDYYPKLVNAIPFTPATGPRLGFSPSIHDAEKTQLISTAITAIKNECTLHGFSGFHSLFPSSSNKPFLNGVLPSQRFGVQFHWFNQGYENFDDFLAHFISRKRKNIRKEREKVRQLGLNIQMRDGTEISEEEWQRFTLLYHRTYIKRSGRTGYLGKKFFSILAAAMPKQILLASAHDKSSNEMIAAALYLRDDTTLYGRYWGATEDMDGLHFECCYYQGIEYAIKHKLERFDPGAQGEHKIQRGFTPVLTSSHHWLAQPDFQQAVDHFLQEEAKHNELYLQECRTSLPFHAEHEVVDKACYLNELETSFPSK